MEDSAFPSIVSPPGPWQACGRMWPRHPPLARTADNPKRNKPYASRPMSFVSCSSLNRSNLSNGKAQNISILR